MDDLTFNIKANPSPVGCSHPTKPTHSLIVCLDECIINMIINKIDFVKLVLVTI